MGSDAARVRPGRAGDIRAMAAVEQRAAPNPWSLSQFLNNTLSKHTGTLVLECRDKGVCGFAVYQQIHDEATLLNIAVEPGMQGRGFGGTLMRALLDRLGDSGARRLLLEVRAGNERAIGLYRRFGFIDDGVRRDYYPSASGREDALLMSCQLEPCQ